MLSVADAHAPLLRVPAATRRRPRCHGFLLLLRGGGHVHGDPQPTDGFPAKAEPEPEPEHEKEQDLAPATEEADSTVINPAMEYHEPDADAHCWGDLSVRKAPSAEDDTIAEGRLHHNLETSGMKAMQLVQKLVEAD